MVDAGDALTEEGKVVHANKVVTDGPFVESKEIVGGFSIVSASIRSLPRPSSPRVARNFSPAVRLRCGPWRD